MEVIYAHKHPTRTTVLPGSREWRRNGIFLPGPSPRTSQDHNWRPEAIEILKQLGYDGNVYVPLPEDGNWLTNYDAQVDWELTYLEAAAVLAFWIPRDLVHLPAFTTNVEFGMFAKSGRCILGYPHEAVKMKYLHAVAERENIPIRHTLMGTMIAAIEKATGIRPDYQYEKEEFILQEGIPEAVTFRPGGGRDVIWCPRINEPTFVTHKDGWLTCDQCGVCDESHPFICHIKKPY